MNARGGWRAARTALCAVCVSGAIAGAHIATAQNVQVPQLPQLPQPPSVPTVPAVPTAPTIHVGAPAAPIITSPKSGAAVELPIVVKGTAAHGVKVTVTATLTASIAISGNMSTKLGEASTNADAQGNWHVSITTKIPVKTSVSVPKINLVAVATNPTTGQTSAAAKVEVVPHT